MSPMMRIDKLFRAFVALAVASTGLAGLGTSTSANAAVITYSDPFCSQFYTQPGPGPGDVTLRCLKEMTCTIATDRSYIAPVSQAVVLTATCSPAAQSYTWSVGVLSPPGCGQPTAGASPSQVTVNAQQAMTCFFEVVASDGAGHQGRARYGIAWTSAPTGCTASVTYSGQSPASLPYTGGSVNVAGACSGGGTVTSWSWKKNGQSFSTVQNPGADSLSPNGSTTSAATYTYTLTACNGTSCAAPVSATASVAAAPVAAPQNCFINRQPSSGVLGAAGGAVSMTANCTGTVTSYTWRKDSVAFGTGQTANDTLPANAGAQPVQYTYDVTACNGSSCAAPVSTTFSVGGTQATGDCSQYSDVVQVDLGYPGIIDTPSIGGLRPNTMFVGKFTVPAGATMPGGQLGRVTGVEWVDPPAYRVASLSTRACDFRGFTPGQAPLGDPTGTTGPLAWTWGMAPTIWYQLLDGVSPSYVKLVPGQTYYFNVRTIDIGSGLTSCYTSTCNMRNANYNPQ
jgi:hypothetical protein